MIADLIFRGIALIIGFLYLLIRYPNSRRRKMALKGKYEDSYAEAGAQLLGNTFAVIWGGVLILFLLFLIYGAITEFWGILMKKLGY